MDIPHPCISLLCPTQIQIYLVFDVQPSQTEKTILVPRPSRRNPDSGVLAPDAPWYSSSRLPAHLPCRRTHQRRETGRELGSGSGCPKPGGCKIWKRWPPRHWIRSPEETSSPSPATGVRPAVGTLAAQRIFLASDLKPSVLIFFPRLIHGTMAEPSALIFFFLSSFSITVCSHYRRWMKLIYWFYSDMDSKH
ncbi:hypothetical protein DAI22_03g298300 [Oryza sativa Japonica Group]|nr:hypothetical protein DAI22_03g298300 [Oryza sativa Japonica Group]